MPAEIFHHIADRLRPGKTKPRRSAHPVVETHYAEKLEDRRMLSATDLVEDVNQQAPPIGYEQGIVVDDVLYFVGRSFVDTGNSGFGFWKYDPAGNNGSGELTSYENTQVNFQITSELVEINSRIYFRDVQGQFFEFNPAANNGSGRLTFLANSPRGYNWELTHLAVLDEEIYYRSSDNEGNFQLWKYQRDSGVSLVTTVDVPTSHTQYPAEEMFVVDGKLYFHVPGEDGEFQLWRHDPNASGGAELTQVVADLFTGVDQPDFAELNGIIYFVAEDDTVGTRLWAYDTVTNQTSAASEQPFPTQPEEIVSTETRVYLAFGSDSINDSGLWEYDPSASDGLAPVTDMADGPLDGFSLASVNDELYFYGNTSSPRKQVLWKYTSGETAGEGQTSHVADIAIGAYSFIGITAETPVRSVGDQLYFQVSGIGFAETLWTHDPFANNGDGETSPVRQDGSETDTSQPSDFNVLDGKLYFRANDGVHGYELWQYDPLANNGTGAATLAADIYPGEGWSYPANITVANGMLFFFAADASGPAVWQFDPSTSDLVRLSDASFTSNNDDWLVFNDRLYIVAENSFGGYRVNYLDLSQSPGGSGLQQIPDPELGSYSNPSRLTLLDGKLYFVGFGGPGGSGLFSFDPEANSGAGETVRVEALSEAQVSPEQLVALGDKLYFRGRSSGHGSELWEYDPSNDGSVRRIADINPGNASSWPQRFTAVNNKLYFLADDGEANFKLWSYDPAASNGEGELTSVVQLDDYGFVSETQSLEASLATRAGKIYLEVLNGNQQEEIWQYDPSTDALKRLQGGGPDLTAAQVFQLTALGDRLYFAGFKSDVGNELFAVDIPPDVTSVDFAFSQSSSPSPGDVRYNATPETISEWDTPTGQVWISIDEDVPVSPFDLTTTITLEDTWFNDPAVTSHLGTGEVESIDSSNGQRTYTLTINDVDLSSYQVGDRVLVANIEFPLDPANMTGISMAEGGSYPAPTTEHGVTLVSAVNASTSEALAIDPYISGQFIPVVYDTNDDGRVGLSDFAGFISNYGKRATESSPQAYRFDFNRDGRVGLSDFAMFINRYGDRKFPAVALAQQSLVMEGEPTDDPLSSSSFSLEGEMVTSPYWAPIASEARFSIVDEWAADHSRDKTDLSLLPLAKEDVDWNARIIDAAMNSDEALATSGEDSPDLSDSMAAWLEVDSTL